MMEFVPSESLLIRTVWLPPMQAFYLRIPNREIPRVRTDERFIRRITMPPPTPVEPVDVPWWLWFVMWSVNREGARELDRAAAARQGKTFEDVGWEKLNAGNGFRAFEWMLSSCDGESLMGATTSGGVPVGIDLGFGPARLVDAPEVKAIAEKLRSLPVRDFLSAYDGALMDKREIFPGGFQADSARWQAELSDLLGKLRDFYERSSEAGDAVLIWIA